MTAKTQTAPSELDVARALVTAIVNDGYVVSVFDGEGWPAIRSQRVTEIVEALASTDADRLMIRRAGLPRVFASITLIWGNSPYELIADYTVSRLTEGWIERGEVARLTALAEQLELDGEEF